MSVAADFWRQVDVRSMRECWLWMGPTQNAYGIFDAKLAHRYAWSFIYGEIRLGGIILHGCDEGRCVNPRHLRVGTHEENGLDRTVLARVQRVLVDAEAAEREIIERAARASAAADRVRQNPCALGPREGPRDATQIAAAANVKRLRIELGMTLEQLGDIVGVRRSNVHRWESGHGVPANRLTAVAVALGVTVAELLA